MAILTRQAVQQLNIIDNPDPARFRDIGYDLTVGMMYVPEDDETNTGPRVSEEYEVPPHGIILIFSRETIDVPQDICGYAMPRTRLCEEGILVLNTGILDPNYRGPISGTAINFRKTPYRIRRGDAFLRLVFEETTTPNRTRHNMPRPMLPNTVANYHNDKMVKAQQYGASFLNLRPMIRTLAEKVSSDLLDKDRRFMGYAIAVAALLFTVLQFITPFMAKLTFSEDTVTTKLLQELRIQQGIETAGLKTQIDAQRLLIEDLRHRVEGSEASRRSTPSPSPRQGP